MTSPVDCLKADIRSAAAALPSWEDPTETDGLLTLLSQLYAAGRRDLPLARLLEGHIDALQIVGRYAIPEIAAATRDAARHGAILGVWNADLRDEPLRFDGGRLCGGKSFASGAGILSHALVTADIGIGRQLLLLDLARVPPEIDRTWWDVVGMARSETHLVRWTDANVDPTALIGAADDYAREPFFSGGALRFVAVHAGGIAALFDHVRGHLVETGRAGNPHQTTRMADLFGLADLAAGAVRRTASRWFDDNDDERLARVAATRMQVADLAQQAISIAQEAVGLQGLFRSHPLAAVITDLMVYLRQPAPDAHRARVGVAAVAGILAPAL